MSERQIGKQEQFIQQSLDDFMDQLYLGGERMSKGTNYNPLEVAYYGSSYLHAIGVNKIPHVMLDSEPEVYLRQIWYANVENEQPYQPASLILGTVVGEAAFSPRSQLDKEQKRQLFYRSINALRRVNGAEGRGDPADFVDIYVSCGEDYYPDKDFAEMRRKLRAFAEGSPASDDDTPPEQKP